MNEILSSPAAPSRRRSGLQFKIGLGLLCFFILSLVGTQIFLHQTSVGSERFIPGTMLLMNLTLLVVVFVLILLLLLARQIVKVHFENRQHIPGTRLKVRLLVAFGTLALMPALLQFFLAYSLISQSIDRWFSAPADQMIRYANSLAPTYYREVAGLMERQTRLLASRLSDRWHEGENPSHTLSDWRIHLANPLKAFPIEVIQVFDHQGRPAGRWTVQWVSEAAKVEDALKTALRGETKTHIHKSASRDLLLCAVPILHPNGSTVGAILMERQFPESISFMAYSVEEALGPYDSLRNRQSEYRWMYMLILVLTSLINLFGFSWFAVYIARRVTGPIQALVEGAAQVAAGNLEYSVQCETSDELQRLVDSFNRMTAELKANRLQIESAYAQLDERRRYIETLLEYIPSGVISTDSTLRITTVNHAAEELLHISRNSSAGKNLYEELGDPLCPACRSLVERALVSNQCTGETEWYDGQNKRHLAISVARLDDTEGQMNGVILLMEDFTELLQAEKMAAWQEVARRLAHEFKNPLTPIQLQAEIIARHTGRLKGEGQEPSASLHLNRETEKDKITSIMENGTQIILQEVRTLTRMVDEFRRFAQMPASRPAPNDLHKIIHSVLSLYEGRLEGIHLAMQLDDRVPSLSLDADQIKRVLVNLVENALIALSEVAGDKRLEFVTGYEPNYNRVRLVLADTGCGIEESDRDNLFLPYFSRSRKGTGLGLAIVKQILDEHQSKIRLEPNEPRGTRVIVDLPIHPGKSPDTV